MPGAGSSFSSASIITPEISKAQLGSSFVALQEEQRFLRGHKIEAINMQLIVPGMYNPSLNADPCIYLETVVISP
jgi:hypothetical protein